jgi:hypothetical protein
MCILEIMNKFWNWPRSLRCMSYLTIWSSVLCLSLSRFIIISSLITFWLHNSSNFKYNCDMPLWTNLWLCFMPCLLNDSKEDFPFYIFLLAMKGHLWKNLLLFLLSLLLQEERDQGEKEKKKWK